MLNEINSDNPVEEVEASDIKEDNTSVISSTPSEEIIKTKDYLSTSLFEDIKTITPEELNSQKIDSSDLNELSEAYSNTLIDISEHQLIEGRVVGMNDRDVLIDIGFKSEGLIDRSEFNEESLPAIGDQVEVYLEYLEDSSGNTILSKEEKKSSIEKKFNIDTLVYVTDITDEEQVKSTSEKIFKECGKIDGLVNNAAVMHVPKQETVDGFEFHFGVNFLGHVLLTELLLPYLKKSKSSRIIHTSSVMHDRVSIDLNDLNFEKNKYSRITAYNISKLAQVLYSRHLAILLKKSNVTSVSIHPGWVQTPLIKNTMPVFFQNILLKPLLTIAGMMKTWPGTQTTLHCLLDDSVPNHSGSFFSQVGIYKDKESRLGGWPMKSPNSQVYNDAICKELYEKSKIMVGQS